MARVEAETEILRNDVSDDERLKRISEKLAQRGIKQLLYARSDLTTGGALAHAIEEASLPKIAAQSLHSRLAAANSAAAHTDVAVVMPVATQGGDSLVWEKGNEDKDIAGTTTQDLLASKGLGPLIKVALAKPEQQSQKQHVGILAIATL